MSPNEIDGYEFYMLNHIDTTISVVLVDCVIVYYENGKPIYKHIDKSFKDNLIVRATNKKRAVAKFMTIHGMFKK